MSEFMQDPLWEEDAKEQILVKPKAEETVMVELSSVGNAALLQSAEESIQTISTTPKADPSAKAETATKPKDDVVEAMPKKKVKDTDDEWQLPLASALSAIHAGALDDQLPPLLDIAETIPADRIQMVANAITSSFLKLPAEARKPVREKLFTELKRWSSLLLARLLLTKLGGIPIAAPVLAPPPPAGDA